MAFAAGDFLRSAFDAFFAGGVLYSLSGGWKMRTVIYVDILLAVNWVVDYFLLVGVAALTGCGAARWRLRAPVRRNAVAARSEWRGVWWRAYYYI